MADASARRLVWIASYPKSGNTWMRILIANAVGSGRGHIAPIGTISSDRRSFDNISGLASSDLTPDEIDLLRPDVYRRQASASARTLYVKAHDTCYRNKAGEWIFPPDCSRGAILVVRHPMDVALSYAHHRGDIDIAEVVRRMGDPLSRIGGGTNRQFHQYIRDWSGHFLTWARQTAIPVIIIRFEDMVADTAGTLAKVLAFVGEADTGALTLKRAVELSRFDRLQAIERLEGFAERPKQSAQFFRNGLVGEGVRALPADIKRAIVTKHGAVMSELGYSQQGSDPLWRRQ